MTALEKAPTPPFALALVTGASSGMGAALCRLLASKNISLLITGRDINPLNALAAELKTHVNVIAFTADISTEEGRATIIKHIYEYHPDLIVNNAGFGLYGQALTYTTKEQLDIVNVNATAVLELTLEGARAMISKGQKGVIFNVSSAAAKQVFPSLAVYAAAKSFVNRMSEALDFEMKPHGIRVLNACPGRVATAFSSRAAGKNDVTNKAGVMSAEEAAQQIWWQIEKGKRVHIFDWKTRLATYFSYLFPKAWTTHFLTKSIESRYPHREIIKKMSS